MLLKECSRAYMADAMGLEIMFVVIRNGISRGLSNQSIVDMVGSKFCRSFSDIMYVDGRYTKDRVDEFIDAWFEVAEEHGCECYSIEEAKAAMAAAIGLQVVDVEMLDYDPETRAMRRDIETMVYKMGLEYESPVLCASIKGKEYAMVASGKLVWKGTLPG
jgi:hypothetical protein